MPLKLAIKRFLAFVISIFIVIIVTPAEMFGQSGTLNTVVIDPGHGGRDPGAISTNGKYYEKNITLPLALKLGDLIKSKYPKVKVIYTRSTDKYLDLSSRTAIANENNADLFISIHINATTSSKVSGTETFVMGTHKSDANFEVCKRENSVLVIEDDYHTKYEGFDPNSPESYIIFSLLQNTHLEQSLLFAEEIQNQFKKGPIYGNRGVKQGGLLVLWKTTMPAILTEVGFISNSSDLKIITSQKGQEQLSKQLFDAFVRYKDNFDAKNSSAKIEVANRESISRNDDFFAIQIFSVGKELQSDSPDLKGWKNYGFVKTGNLYKYYVGRYNSSDEAKERLREVRKSFRGAFIINVKDGKIVK